VGLGDGSDEAVHRTCCRGCRPIARAFLAAGLLASVAGFVDLAVLPKSRHFLPKLRKPKRSTVSKVPKPRAQVRFLSGALFLPDSPEISPAPGIAPSGDEFEGCDVSGTNDAEVAAIERCDGHDAKPLGGGNN
jgi:hypothetical protein